MIAFRFRGVYTRGFSACPICIRNGTVALEMGHSRLTSSFTTDKLLTYTKGSSMSPLRHDLLILETVQNSPEAATATTACTESEMGHLGIRNGTLGSL